MNYPTPKGTPYPSRKYGEKEFSLFDVADENGNPHPRIMYLDTLYTLVDTDSDFMTATYKIAELQPE